MKKHLEVEQGKNVVEACKANNVKQLIWSTLDDCTKGWYSLDCTTDQES